MTSILDHSKSNHAIHFGQSNDLVSATNWFAKKWQEYRDKKSLNQQIKLLKTLDHHILWDIGIDIDALYAAHPRIELIETSEPYRQRSPILLPLARIR
jgi:uncharacterized protein YjiS (DUF1127 family)